MSHVKIKRGVYWHHGIQMSDGSVVHYTGRGGERTREKKNALIQQTAMDKFVRESTNPVVIVDHEETFPAEEVEKRAKSCIGEDDYHLIQHNCEHFAVWCVTGKDESKQIEKIAKRASNGGKAVLASSLLLVGFKAAKAAKSWLSSSRAS